jgi:hypothetical protein
MFCRKGAIESQKAKFHNIFRIVNCGEDLLDGFWFFRVLLKLSVHVHG